MKRLTHYFSRTRAATPAIETFRLQLARNAFMAAAYVIAAAIARHFALPLSIASPLWPSAALALCACMAWGVSIMPGICIGAAIAAWYAGFAPGASFLSGVGSATEAAVAAWLAGIVFEQRADVIYHEKVFRFIAIAVASSAIAATIGVIAFAISGKTSAAGTATDWLTWWIGDAGAMIIAAPLLLSWNLRGETLRDQPRITEAVLLAFATALLASLVFNGTFKRMPLAYLTFCPVMWAAFRFPLPAVTWTAGAISVIAAWHTVHGRGPFAWADPNVSLLLLATYIGVISTTSLVLGGLVHLRRDAEAALRAERSSLEERLQEHTAALRADIERRKQVEQQLADAQRLAQLGSWQWDTANDSIVWSDEMYRIAAVESAQFRPTRDSCRALIEPEDLPSLQQAVMESLRDNTPFERQHRLRTPAGTRTVHSRGYLQRSARTGHVTVLGTMQDITEAKKAEAALREAEERYRTLLEVSPDAILVQQGACFVFANGAACRLLLAPDPGAILGKPVFTFIHPDYHGITRERLARLNEGQAVPTLEEKMLRLDGSPIDVEINSSPLVLHGKPASLLIARDITERRRTAEQMAYMAHYDALTGLPNRVLFHQRLGHALSVAARPGTSLEILFLDLDRFKNINDTLGHAVGDLVLQEAARRLQGILRESDTVARLGGDEFVVLVENVDEPHRGGTIADKILASFKPPFLQDREPLAVTTSIGIASYPADGKDAETLLKNADIAMYRAKETGRHTYCYYSPELNRHTAERLALEYALATAMEQNELSLHYQPRIDLLSNSITGMEALLRWWHPTLGPVPPERFIPIAEETGLIVPIGYWALRTACEQNRRWQEHSTARLRVSVNLSQRQLTDAHLLDNLAAILADTGLEPRFLEIEITESALMTDPAAASDIVHALADMGITISIDDFGTGYSSLAHLKQFPIRAVKIDRSFVQGLPGSHGDSAITRAIISLAHTLECSVVAEGAETQQQFEFLRDHDCDSVQGYYFSAPMAAEMFGDLLKTQSRLHLH